MSVSEVDSVLKQLVSDYYHGLLTFESYREQRGQLLDKLDDAQFGAAEASDKVEATTANTLGSDTTERAGEQRDGAGQLAGDAGLSAPKGAGHARRGGRVWGGLVIAIVVAGTVSFGLLQWRANDSGGAAGPGATGRPAAPESPGETLLDQFLTRGDWADDSRRNFTFAWNALADAQRNTARESAEFRRLADSLRRRLLEEEALGGPGTTEFRALLAFAGELAMPFTGEFEARLANAALEPRAADPGGASEAPTAGPDLEDDVAPPEPANATPEPTETPPAAAPARQAADAATSDAVVVPAVAAGQIVLDGGAADDPCRAELAATRRPYCQDLLAGGTLGPGLAVLPPGRFTMGGQRSPEEGPPHEVVIPRAFAIAVYETSYDEFTAFCRAAGQPCPERAWGDEDSPIVLVSFEDANAYALWLSEQTGFAYRLPSEAEWEYAARAGTTTPYFFGDEVTPSSARSSANVPADGPLPRSDQSVNRNPFRLFHMAGNVREWVADSWHDDYTGAPVDGGAWSEDGADTRIVRGGSYADPGTKIRSAAREPLAAGTRDRATGFRIARDINQ